ncbi:hypothetical protein [Elizabethkingia ursingii]|uniref:hypothetical protein n=1 Tax=Elizabethkingia ursingii TaxID=1756150 RepID=UPI00075124A3|nr:hypothetical protein [Elizabethkingia ursingii]KUY29895.1 hypothetical protein ATB96_17625 [Elizabethkingia ursingii]
MKKILSLFCLSVWGLTQLSCIKSDHKLEDGKALVNQSEKSQAVSQMPPVKRLSDRADTLTYEVNLDRLPTKLLLEFKNENQKLLLVLKNSRNRNVSLQIIPASDLQNIRINNILLGNKTINGPLGKQIDYLMDHDYSIVIGKSLMASESQIGRFSIILK